MNVNIKGLDKAELLDYPVPAGIHPNEARWRSLASKLKDERDRAHAAIRTFTDRVERGEFHGVVTYLAFKEALGETIIAGCNCPRKDGRPNASWQWSNYHGPNIRPQLLCNNCHKPYIPAK